MKQLVVALLAAAATSGMLSAAEIVTEPFRATETNSPPVPHLLSTNQPSFFYADNRTSATYVKFAPDGFYEIIQKEHMGVVPWDTGRWSQETNGVITLKSANKNRGGRAQQKVIPTAYRDKTFLVWPDVSYKSNLQRACKDLETGKTPNYHEFLISEEQFRKGTAKPYPFKYRKEMNKLTGAQE